MPQTWPRERGGRIPAIGKDKCYDTSINAGTIQQNGEDLNLYKQHHRINAIDAQPFLKLLKVSQGHLMEQIQASQYAGDEIGF